MGETKMISLPAAAFRLRLPWMQAYSLLLRGTLAGERVGARWYVRESDVERIAHEREQRTVGEGMPALAGGNR